MKLRIYGKKDCHLCDVAKEVLHRFARLYPVIIDEIDIEGDAEACERYQYEIPVVFLEGQKLFKYRIDEKKLKKAIETRMRKGS